MTIISLSIPDLLIKQIDQTIKEKGFVSRSEIVRQSLRRYLTEDIRIEDTEADVVATITLIYREDADRRRILEAQHIHSGLVSTFLHAHITPGFCMEVIILNGKAALIRKFVDTLKQNEQIIQIKISVISKK